MLQDPDPRQATLAVSEQSEPGWAQASWLVASPMAEVMVAVLMPATSEQRHDVPAGLPPVQWGAVKAAGACLQSCAPGPIVPKSRFTVPRTGSLTFTPFPSRVC